MKRLLIAALILAGFATGGVVPPPAQAAGTGLVSWVVNHKQRTITVSVKIEIYVNDCPAGASYCGINEATIATWIEKNIRESWSGHHYKCYQLVIDVKVSVVPDRFHVSSNAVGVLIDRSDMQGVVSDTRPTVESAAATRGEDTWQSNDPSKRLEVTNSVISPSTWSYPPIQNYSYAHEFGHVLGLEHYYDGDGNLKAGAPNDVMYESGDKFVSQETVDRVVERNADRMFDTDGKPVDPNKLHCDNLFRATLSGDETYYGATHFVDSIAKPPCSAAPFTHSTDQTLHVKSEPVDIQVLEDEQLAPLFYELVPVFDMLYAQNGLRSRPREAVGIFDLPITVDVGRNNNTPATGDIPPVYDFLSGVCTGGDGGHPEPPDCGNRKYLSWMAMVQSDDDQISPAGSSVPILLYDLGYRSPRLEQLYKNCGGPTPYPGVFVEDGSNVTLTPGTLPALDVFKKVESDWYVNAIAGRVTITGTATSNQLVTGHLDRNTFNWTLTLCPLNQDGDPPPGCP